MRFYLLRLRGLKIEGEENLLELEDGFVLASNHVHELDGFLIPAIISRKISPRPFYPVAREKSFYKDKGIRGKLYGGRFFRFMGAFPAKVGQNNYHKSLTNQFRILEAGYPVLIFPEGKVKRRQDIPLEKVKGGAAFLAHMAGKPFVPVHLSSWQSHPDGHHNIKIGKPVNLIRKHGEQPLPPHEYKKVTENLLSSVQT